MKRFFYYFAWSIAIALIVYLGLQLQELLKERMQTTFNLVPYWIYVTLFPIVIGILLRTPKFMLERKEKRISGFDWSKFLAVGLLSFVVIVLSLMPFLPLENLPYPEFYNQISLILFSSTTAQTIAGLVFGYTLLDSFKSEERRFQESTSDLFNAVMKFTPKG
ncbi:hypothetical protein [Planococcus maritimus]|uniref:hypothetical protein n=1 Tax=Planococcus maritimus TaxID=192421 RepID=UPI0007966168|nr:hypothetical protein [Planococcus maritimus]KYG59495.1 hypothetical protein AY633_04430 [Planococcus maritimus]OED33193.1 hypothetical protein BHE17_12310 [Planococcus maritimus]